MNPIFIAGPCVIESAELLDVVAQELVRIREKSGAQVSWRSRWLPHPN